MKFPRAVSASHLVALVCAGARPECGKLVERDPVLEATHTACDVLPDPLPRRTSDAQRDLFDGRLT